MDKEFIKQTIHSFVELIEKRDSYTAGHSLRVAYYSTQIARELKFSDEEIDLIYNSALMHDIGKIGIPDSILLKPGKLTVEEYRMMKEHVNIGFTTIKAIDYFSQHAFIIKDHHERYDGKGYPDGKKGDEISIFSYILSVADSFDAMTTTRIYNQSKTPKEAYEILKSQEGTHFPHGFVESIKNVLLNQTIDIHKEQKPENEFEHEKFAFHFKDTLTGLNSESYLNFFILENIKYRTHKCIYYVYLKNMTQFNKDNSWEEGDELLKSFASILKNKFPDSELFRVKGDGFLIINKSHYDLNINDLTECEVFDNTCIKVDVHHFDFTELKIDSVKEFEQIVFEEFTKQYRDETKKKTLEILKTEEKSYEEKIQEIDLDSIIKDFELFNELISAQDKEFKSLISEKNDLIEKFFNQQINLQLIADFEGRIVDISKNSLEILGYADKDLINTSFLDLVHPEDIEATINEMSKLNEGKHVFYFENRYKHKNGDYITLAWSACANDKKTLIYASAHDNSKLIEKENIIIQQSKLASMGEMIENIIHQWKQPISLIKTISTGIKLRKEVGAIKDDEILELMEKITLTADHLSQTISDFKDFYRKKQDVSHFSLLDTISKVEGLIEHSIVASKIKLKKSIKDVYLIGNQSELIQVFLNLINNSIDEFKKLNQNVNLIYIEVYNDNGKATINVKDNAGGIPENIIDKVFDSHFTTKETTGGSGIGLYMSKKIIKEHLRGTIEVNTENLNYENLNYLGTKFTMTIPINQ